MQTASVYTQAVGLTSEDYVCSVAKTIQGAGVSLEEGFGYITEIDRVKLFRKLK